MATFRLLADHYIANQVLLAGTIQSTGDVPGGLLPINWKPSGNVDPLDTAAVNLFYAAGPQFAGSIRAQWSTIPVSPPVTYWKSVPGTARPTSYQLTGLGGGQTASAW